MTMHVIFSRAVTIAGVAAGVGFTGLGVPAATQAAQPQRVTVFERAEFVLSKDARPPDDTAAWEPVTLPHEWRRTHPGMTGQGWYRIKFNLSQAPKIAKAININYASRLGRADFF